jgi:hypothetical protein
LTDRKDKRVEAFTFGGALSVEPDAAQTVCHFRSPAPILARSSQGTPQPRVAPVPGFGQRQQRF